MLDCLPKLTETFSFLARPRRLVIAEKVDVVWTVVLYLQESNSMNYERIHAHFALIRHIALH